MTTKRRIVFKLGLFLLLGAVANAAVAVVLCTRQYAATPDLPIVDTSWIDANDLKLPIEARQEMRPTFGVTRCAYVKPRFLMSNSYLGTHARVGWPLRAFDGGAFRQSSTTAPRYIGAIKTCDWMTKERIWPDGFLPVSPLWPGFAINTIFYAGVCWILFAGPFALRRRRRIKRGLCTACAYPVGESAVCTECGKPVMAPRPVITRPAKGDGM